MVATFLVAAAVGAVASPLDNVAILCLLIPCCAFLLFAVYVLLVILPYMVWVSRLRCPACNERRLICRQVVATWPPLLALHRCEACGSLFQRWSFGRWLAVSLKEAE